MLMKAVETYLAVRRTVGFGLKTTEWYLRNFARFATDYGDTYVVAKTAIDWAAQAPSEAQRDNRLKMIIRFARFIRAEDNHHEIPPDDVFCGQRHRPTPYIFTDDEIRLIVTHAARLGPPGSLRPHTYSTLFALLAITGLRCSEALALCFKDFTQEALFIRETKFRKSRLTPLHKTATDALQRYLTRRYRFAGNDDHIFVSSRRHRLSRTVVVETFHEVLRAAGIPKMAGQPIPRLLDLRHTFAVRALESCPDGRDNIRQHMLALSTYMGHACIESTYWYIESTPQLMIDIAHTCESFVKGGEMP